MIIFFQSAGDGLFYVDRNAHYWNEQYGSCGLLKKKKKKKRSVDAFHGGHQARARVQE